VAPYEADAQLAYLERTGKISLIISEDSDLIAFGCKRVRLEFCLGFLGDFINLLRYCSKWIVKAMVYFLTATEFPTQRLSHSSAGLMPNSGRCASCRAATICLLFLELVSNSRIRGCGINRMLRRFFNSGVFVSICQSPSQHGIGNR
jgi:hypothetical protein